MVDFYGEPENPVREQRENRGTETAQPGAEELNLDGAKLGGGALTPEELSKAVDLVREIIHTAASIELDLTPAQQRDLFHSRLGDAPIPKEVIDALLRETIHSHHYGVTLELLARGRGAEILPWVEHSLQSEDPVISGFAMVSLLFIDEARGIQEIQSRFEALYRHYWEIAFQHPRPLFFSPNWVRETLIEVGSPACLAEADRIVNLCKQIRNELGME